MYILIDNIVWIAYNIALGAIAVVLGWLAVKISAVSFKTIFGLLWFLFIPNTIYILTDIAYLPKQLKMLNDPLLSVILVLEYVFFMLAGIIMFIVGLYPVERIFSKFKILKHNIITTLLIFLINFIFAMAVVIGKAQRTNSWDVFFNLEGVFKDTLTVLSSKEYVVFIILFGFFSSLLYFALRGVVIKTARKVVFRILHVL